MADSSNPQHPLVRDGRSQIERLDLGALAPESVALDDRSERQLLVYLNEFAKAVAFYQTDGSANKNLQQSNWQPFFRSSSSVQVSLIETVDTTDFETRYNTIKQQFAEGLNRGKYGLLFDFLFDSTLTVNGWFTTLSSDFVLLDNRLVLNETPLRRIIQDLIQSNMQPALGQLFAIANLFVTSTASPAGYRLPDLSALQKIQGTDLWQLDSIQFVRDSTLASLTAVERASRIEERLDTIFRTFAKTMQTIVEEAARQDILQPTQTHEPHLALLYTFLRLFHSVVTDNDGLNGLTRRHLDFYYRDVLKLQPKPLVSDSVHVLFELPKPLPQYQVRQSTLLKDGKDGHKVDVRFALDDEIIVTQTQIAELRTLFRDEASFLARPKANSSDGLGKDFANPLDVKWPTLGATEDNVSTAIKATAGIAIVSKSLILSSGIRVLTLTLTCKDPVSDKALNAFDVRLSGAKKWITVPNATTTISPDKLALIVTITLGIKDDPIAVADPAVLGVDYGLADQAVVQLLLKDQPGLYESMRSVQIVTIHIKTDVSQLQNVLIRTDDGDQDPTKPFAPFGAIPSVGSTFAIGSPEIFAKELTGFTVKFEWDKRPADVATYYEGYSVVSPSIVPTNENTFSRDVFFYKDGFFNEKPATGSVFNALTLATSDFHPATKHTNELSSVAAIKDPAWQEGIIIIRLEHDFLHQYYTEALTRKALALTTPVPPATTVEATAVTPKAIDDVEAKILSLPFTPIAPTATAGQQQNQADALKSGAKAQVDTLKSLSVKSLTINPPYTAIIKNLTVSYTAETSEATLLHILPFDNGTNFRSIELNASAPPFLVDNFTDQGALLIGLSDAIEENLVPILFQLLESSAKTNLSAATINWTYLDGNDWQTLEAGTNLLNDATRGFIQSGIVQIILPKRTAPLKTTILPASFFWLKAATSDNTEAVCKAVGVHTQAARATFAPVTADDPAKQNDPARLAAPLAAGSVTKLDTADVNIKSVKQPYPSFGGRPAESQSHFYSRVSEQLRHKGRGITLFDYEQLILEAFPELFKVKCIPHTFANQRVGSTNATINDVHTAPGHVTVVVVPDATQTQLDDPEKPMASRGLLTRIADWMKARISPFAKLQVLNPIYQPVDTEFSIQFYADKSPEFYRERLRKDIGQFLAPWTFDPKAQVTFGGLIYRSSILGFIENRDYVDFVTDFIMRIDGVEHEEIQASAARVIFTNGTHDISLFKKKPAQKAPPQGIGINWQIASSTIS